VNHYHRFRSVPLWRSTKLVFTTRPTADAATARARATAATVPNTARVGWSMDATMTSRLVVDALEMALARRLKGSSSSGSGLVAHSDRGSQYASEHYQRRLSEERIECSMSGVGQCWDNAAMESFFASLKTEATTTACR